MTPGTGTEGPVVEVIVPVDEVGFTAPRMWGGQTLAVAEVTGDGQLAQREL